MVSLIDEVSKINSFRFSSQPFHHYFYFYTSFYLSTSFSFDQLLIQSTFYFLAITKQAKEAGIRTIVTLDDQGGKIR